MKKETKIQALNNLIAAYTAAKKLTDCKNKQFAHIGVNKIRYGQASSETWDAHIADENARITFHKRSKAQRDYASDAHTRAVKIGQIAVNQVASYSGDTKHQVEWGPTTCAETITSSGDQYSRRCTFKKTDATHIVTLNPSDILDLLEDEPLRLCSEREGMPLIAYDAKTGKACWVVVKNKQITEQWGWIAHQENACYHSLISLKDAQTKLARKIQKARKEALAISDPVKCERRAKLVTRLCKGAVATIRDAKKLGFCDAGIKAFQSRFGIGDSAPLHELVNTGDPSATRLAFYIARRLKAA